MWSNYLGKLLVERRKPEIIVRSQAIYLKAGTFTFDLSFVFLFQLFVYTEIELKGEVGKQERTGLT